MFLVSLKGIRAHTWLSTARGTTALRSSLPSPGPQSEFLASVLNRPDAEHFGKDDRIELRSAANFNLVGCLVNEVVSGPPRRRALSTTYPIPIAVGSEQQQLRVEEARFVDTRVGALAHQQIRLSIDIPLVMPRDDGPRRPRIPIATPEQDLLPSSGTLSNVRAYLRHAPDGLVQLAGAANRDTREQWFDVSFHPFRIRLRDPAGRYLAWSWTGIAAEHAEQHSSRFEFTLHKQYAPSSRLLLHGDRVKMRTSEGFMLTAPVVDGPAPLQLTPVGSENESNFFAVQRAAGEGLVRDGDRIFLAAGATIGGPRRLSIDADGLRFVSGGGTPLTIEFTKEFRWSIDSAGNHTSTAGAIPAGATDRGVVGKIFIGCPMHGSPLATWTVSGRQEVSGLLQHFSRPRRGTKPAFDRIDGFVLAEPALGTSPIKTYINASTGRDFATLRADQEREAAGAGLAFGWIEGHAYSAPLPALAPPPAAKPHSANPTIDPRIGGGANVSVGGRTTTQPGGTTIDPRHAARLGGIGVALGRRLSGSVSTSGFALPSRRVRALVLSGGGAKGCFEAGAVNALYGTGWRPDVICGVSAGAVNAVKLAEGENAHTELVDLWRDFGARKNAIVLREFYLGILKLLADRVTFKLKETGGAAGFMAVLGAPSGFLTGAVATGAGALIGKELSGLDPAVVRLANFMLNLFPGVHSMEPLRRLLQNRIDPVRIARSGVHLRIGITDLGSGQFFSVTEPDPALGPANADSGYIECEPDHQLGGSWLTEPIFAADGYLMPLKDAVYASCVQPVFMDATACDLTQGVRIATGDATFIKLACTLPPGVLDLLAFVLPAAPDARLEFWPQPGHIDVDRLETAIGNILAKYFQPTSPSTSRADARALRDGDRGSRASVRMLFDGGLRDTLPIRTALRMGATEIISISGDRLGQTPFSALPTRSLNPVYANGIFSLLGDFLNGIDLMSVQPLRNAFGMLNLFTAEVARSDSLLAWSQAEFSNWMGRAAARLPETAQRELREELERYWRSRDADAMEAMGATTWTGGTMQTLQTPWGQKCSITHIVPPRDFVEVLGFDDIAGIEDGIRLGQDAARTAWHYVRSA